MSGFVDKDAIARARKADLYGFLLASHPDSVRRLGQYLQLKSHDSVMVKKGFPGFVRNSTKESGNPIDFLVNYLGYSFTDAVRTLSGWSLSYRSPASALLNHDSESRIDGEGVFPEKAAMPYRRTYAYLTSTRGLSGDTVNGLISAGLIYQDVRGNAVFMNHAHNYCEIRGTFSHVKFHQICKSCDESPYWYFSVGRGSPVFYVCESAIDAISLYELQKLTSTLSPGSVFCSIGGAGKQHAISFLAGRHPGGVVLAVDNDAAGEECRLRNKGLPCLVPSWKDWNDDLARLKAGKAL